jgi:hypothetical protein
MDLSKISWTQLEKLFAVIDITESGTVSKLEL